MRLLHLYKRIALVFFGGMVQPERYFPSLARSLMKADIRILLKTWVAMAILTAFIMFIGTLIGVLVYIALVPLDLITFMIVLVMLPLLATVGSFLFFILYPIQRANTIRRQIENDLPFATTHMSAIVSSGIPPEFMFGLLANYKEYGIISRQAELIVRNMKTFGMSSISAINNIAKRTPSPEFRQLLTGISATIEKGGNLTDYLRQMADTALFDYRIKREKYLKTLSTYADIYTALLVAAPLMLLAVLGIMSIIGGTVLGLTINELITVITFIGLPVLNILFLAFIHITYPGA
ncbi:MAG: type II secretion system F family protein [Nanoarchaeota archaeon]|nr:type II secretion system F family protein [Nanoarchaeota archaeon]